MIFFFRQKFLLLFLLAEQMQFDLLLINPCHNLETNASDIWMFGILFRVCPVWCGSWGECGECVEGYENNSFYFGLAVFVFFLLVL